ncbi:MAG: helicase-related protein [Pseudomonadota bacterium]|nr:helicase-related protein [Pseudomonadota bacterium]
MAFERMLAYNSGIIGFPLRLLARENYERAVMIKGSTQVALVTGEEKILPPQAKYYFCTVEAMPISKPVDFMAIDEIQMCADPDRGHIFTDRLLNARGRYETMFMGAETIKHLIKLLVPEVDLITRKRLSSLSYLGSRKITKLLPRSAVVGFSANDIYATAELIRQQCGGAAIVMGALSPRTRNAQVDMFQNGDVDYLVATDAIGMGLNMDVNHIAFASIVKFDGEVRRTLRPDEMAQIAGRAGRFMRDGTFGITGDIKNLDPEIIESIEKHRFDNVNFIYWRNRNLDFSSVSSLLSSLKMAPTSRFLTKVRGAEDERFLGALLRDREICNTAQTECNLRLLWEVSQVPDFKHSDGVSHGYLLSQFYRNLIKLGQLPVEWVEKQVTRLDRNDGGIDSLLERIAGIRVWTYVAHKDGWLLDSEFWQDRTLNIEDKLSDALHHALTGRFVDRRTTSLVKKMRENVLPQAAVKAGGEIILEGHMVGKLEGFRFVAESTGGAVESKILEKASQKVIKKEISQRAKQILKCSHKLITLSETGVLLWMGKSVGKLSSGRDFLNPKVNFQGSVFLDKIESIRIKGHLEGWLQSHIRALLTNFFNTIEEPFTGHARGLAFQLLENQGILSKENVKTILRNLSSSDYSTFKRLGVKFGRKYLYFPSLLRPKSARLTALLWAIFQNVEAIPAPVPPGRVSLAVEEKSPAEFFFAAGFRRVGPLFLRVDIIERLIGQIRAISQNDCFELDVSLLNLLGCSRTEMVGILADIGWFRENKNGKDIYKPLGKSRKNNRKRRGKKVSHITNEISSSSPFSVLKDIVVQK